MQDVDRRPPRRLGDYLHAYLFDHAFLRVLWTNTFEIAPGIWRANQPSPRRVRQLKRMGIKTLINLRGQGERGIARLEAEEALAEGITLMSHSLYSGRLMPKLLLLAVLDSFDLAERPLLMHCKSGADRTGLAAAMWLIHVEGRPTAEARRMLSKRFLHLTTKRTAGLHRLLDLFARDGEATGQTLREWLTTSYDQAAA